jgi:hypothetical protein
LVGRSTARGPVSMWPDDFLPIVPDWESWEVGEWLEGRSTCGEEGEERKSEERREEERVRESEEGGDRKGDVGFVCFRVG